MIRVSVRYIASTDGVFCGLARLSLQYFPGALMNRKIFFGLLLVTLTVSLTLEFIFPCFSVLRSKSLKGIVVDQISSTRVRFCIFSSGASQKVKSSFATLIGQRLCGIPLGARLSRLSKNLVEEIGV